MNKETVIIDGVSYTKTPLVERPKGVLREPYNKDTAMVITYGEMDNWLDMAFEQARKSVKDKIVIDGVEYTRTESTLKPVKINRFEVIGKGCSGVVSFTKEEIDKVKNLTPEELELLMNSSFTGTVTVTKK